MSFESNGKNDIAKRLAWVTIYAVAMGYVESAVVIYIRAMAFSDLRRVFPLVYLDPQIGMVELGREAATVVMLIAVGYLVGKNKAQKWLFFVYAFAIWDIVYYIVLKLAVGWPASIMSFDVLFLIPVIWIGPVLTPLLVSALLSIGSGILLVQSEKSDHIGINWINLVVFIFGCGMVLYSFTQETFQILYSKGPQGLAGYAPKSFDWTAFLIGYLIMCYAVLRMVVNSHRKAQPSEVTK